MAVVLPTPIAAYMVASARLDAVAILAAFADDAVVLDERQTHRGRGAIGAWIAAAAIANAAVPTPVAVARADDAFVVTAEVAGTFQGSPIRLDFRFTLADDRITRLEIA